MRKDKRWYLIAYDVRQKKRLQRLYKFLQRHCLVIQESVLIFHGHAEEWQQLQAGICQRIKKSEDDVRVYRLPANSCLEFTGRLPWPEGVFFGGCPPFKQKPITSD